MRRNRNMSKKADKFAEEKFNKLKKSEADLVRDLQTVISHPEEENKLSKQIFQNHQTWLKIIMPNYSPEIHLSIVNSYQCDKRYRSYYDDKAGKGATKILIKSVKKYLTK
ncbi:hypothetical protein DS833_04880 [Lactobacillus bombicola]|uniref:TipAS antibiotic-recognition domain-containing protein n=2 Tax=Lactobacillus bombicola TaxID=1505723 RepID=A0ABX9LY11_9LACO|nr:hypothetical protein DS833_04880 [Lactobacillus bombicola]RHW52878.1 hypothetical protein DS834_03060 [Lactobacillus bombicola]